MADRLLHSITLYGFGDRYVHGSDTLEDILQRAKDCNGDGFEIVAPQMVEGHPNPGEDWKKYFIDAYHKYDLVPVCYSIYVDSGKHKGRFLTEEERLTETINEMEVAKELGFKVVRSQDALLPRTMEKLLPYAEALDLHLAIEMHGPYCPTSPIFMEYEDLFNRANSEHLGVVMDFSAFTSGAPATVLNRFPDDCCNKPLIHKIRRLYEKTETPEEDLIRQLYAEGGDEVDEMIVRKEIFSIPKDSKFGAIYWRTQPDYEGFRRLLKWSKYMHGKFMYVDDDLVSEGTDFPGFVRIMKEENYQGFIASEYEGNRFLPGESDDVQIKKHIRMLDKLWAEA